MPVSAKPTLTGGPSGAGTIASTLPSSNRRQMNEVGVMKARIWGSLFLVRKLLPIDTTTNMARINLAAPRRIVDLGCGPGNSTGLLRERWPEATITGLDSSADMLDAARRDYPGIEFIGGDIAKWAPAEPYDLVFSNAALQWVG